MTDPRPTFAPHNRPPERVDELLEALRDYWDMHPDYRLGQILHIFATELAGAMRLPRRPEAIRELEDQALTAMLRMGVPADLAAMLYLDQHPNGHYHGDVNR